MGNCLNKKSSETSERLRLLLAAKANTPYFSLGGEKTTVKICNICEKDRKKCEILMVIGDAICRFRAEFNCEVPEKYVNCLIVIKVFELTERFRCEFTVDPVKEDKPKRYSYAIDPIMSELEDVGRGVMDGRKSVDFTEKSGILLPLNEFVNSESKRLSYDSLNFTEKSGILPPLNEVINGTNSLNFTEKSAILPLSNKVISHAGKRPPCKSDDEEEVEMVVFKEDEYEYEDETVETVEYEYEYEYV